MIVKLVLYEWVGWLESLPGCKLGSSTSFSDTVSSPKVYISSVYSESLWKQPCTEHRSPSHKLDTLYTLSESVSKGGIIEMMTLSCFFSTGASSQDSEHGTHVCGTEAHPEEINNGLRTCFHS